MQFYRNAHITTILTFHIIIIIIINIVIIVTRARLVALTVAYTTDALRW